MVAAVVARRNKIRMFNQSQIGKLILRHIHPIQAAGQRAGEREGEHDRAHRTQFIQVFEVAARQLGSQARQQARCPGDKQLIKWLGGQPRRDHLPPIAGLAYRCDGGA